jgi:hypothetical protein
LAAPLVGLFRRTDDAMDDWRREDSPNLKNYYPASPDAVEILFHALPR